MIGSGASRLFPADRLDLLIQALRASGHLVIGPRVDGGAVIYDEITCASDLPVGWGDEQEKATYRLRRRPEPTFFGFNSSPESWKKLLHPSRMRLWQACRDDTGTLVFTPDDRTDAPRLAFLGVRGCDLHAIRIQARVREVSRLPPDEKARQPAAAVVIGVACGQAARTCFCASMGTGPELPTGCDIELTELYDDAGHRFLAVARTDAGAALLDQVGCTPASSDDRAAGAAQINATRGAMHRRMPAEGLRDFLAGTLESPHWDAVAERCLSCANCTLVCPTCFCTTTEDTTDLTGDHAERWLRWDSCFTLDFSYVHGGSVRASTRSRYRQWLTHKLGTWHDQFGSTGCVGCGRCIAWCPVGIDITEEVASLHAVAEAAHVPEH